MGLALRLGTYQVMNPGSKRPSCCHPRESRIVAKISFSIRLQRGGGNKFGAQNAWRKGRRQGVVYASRGHPNLCPATAFPKKVGTFSESLKSGMRPLKGERGKAQSTFGLNRGINTARQRSEHDVRYGKGHRAVLNGGEKGLSSRGFC